MRIAYVTGGTGVVGMALLRILLMEQWNVVLFLRPDSNRHRQVEQAFARELEMQRLRIVSASLADFGTLTAKDVFLDGSKERSVADSIFFHLGWDGTFGEARNSTTAQLANVGFTRDAVYFAKELQAKTFVFAGSQAEFGPKEEPLSAELLEEPVTEYGKAKLMAGRESRALCQELQIRHIWCRILSVYGPYDGEKTMVTSAIRQLLMGECPKFSQATQEWDYLYADDAANALLLAGERGRDGAIYCVGSGIGKPLKEYIYQIRDTIDPKLAVAIGALPMPKETIGCVTYLVADIHELSKDTGFRARTPFALGIVKTIDWNRKVLSL